MQMIKSFQISNTKLEEVIVPSFFQNGMIFQQKKPIGICGIDNPGTIVNVCMQSINFKRIARTVANLETGYWWVELNALDASFQKYTLEISGSDIKVFDNLLIGELFLAAGQSNMFIPIENSLGGKALAEDNTRENLRMLWMPTNPVDNGSDLSIPQFDYLDCKWFDGTNKNMIESFSAVAYTYARMLYDNLNANGDNVPVGIMDTSMGSLLIEAYMSRNSIERNDEVLKIVKENNNVYKTLENIDKKNLSQISTFFNSKIAPLSVFNIRGILWYQGESNNCYPEEYEILLNALLKDWSQVFRSFEENLPFICIHLAPHNTLVQDGNEYTPRNFDAWPRINESIDKVWHQNRKTFIQIPIYDIPTIANSNHYTSDMVEQSLRVISPTSDHPIHPITKQPVGERAAFCTLGLLYGRDYEYNAPVIKSFIQDGSKLIVTFENVGEGLKLITGTNILKGFEICGSNGIYTAAKARIIRKDRVEIWNEFITSPVFCNYAFSAMNCTASLCNSSDIPAVPFRCNKENTRNFFYNKDWAFCDNIQIWVDSGYYHVGSLEGLSLKLAYVSNIPMTFQGSDMLDAWEISPICGSVKGELTIDKKKNSNNPINIMLTYESDGSGLVGFGPILQHASQNNSFAFIRYIAFDISNDDNREKSISASTVNYDGEIYKLPFCSGEIKELLPAMDGEFHAFIIDLNKAFDNNEKIFRNSAERNYYFSSIKQLQITINDLEDGAIRFNNFRFGPDDSDTIK